MPIFDVSFMNKDDEPAWPDLIAKSPTDLYIVAESGGHGEPVKIVVLDGGMKSGKPSIAVRCDLNDGRCVIIQTSARAFCTAARAIMAKYPDLFEDAEGDSLQ